MQGGLHLGGLGRLPPSDFMGYSQRTGSTHPTGMHSFDKLLKLSILIIMRL